MVRNLKGKPQPYSVALGHGMSCNVATNGMRTLYLRARLHGTLQRLLLGIYPSVTMKAAADKAEECRAMMKAGLDPRVHALRTANGDDVPKTVKEAALRFIAGHVKVKTRDRWAEESERLINAEVIPQIGSYPLVQLQRSDLTGLVERKAAAMRKAGGKGVVANRLAAVLSKFCSYCASQGWLAHDLGRSLPKPARETAKDRTLSPAEMGSLWNALIQAREGRGVILPVYSRIIAMLALTGARCAEITNLKLADLNAPAGVLVIRGGKTQASNRNLPLPAMARSILAEQINAADPQKPEALVFPAPRSGKVLPSNEISRAARHIVEALGHEPWTPHDLRRTLATVLAEQRIPGDVARRITGHIATDIHGAVYDRATRYEDMRAALTVMEQWISAAAAKEGAVGANVVPIRRTVED